MRVARRARGWRRTGGRMPTSRFLLGLQGPESHPPVEPRQATGTAILDGEGSSTDRRPCTCSSWRSAVRIADELPGRDDASVVAAIFEAPMSREQAERLAVLMQEGRATRPEGVLTAA